MFITMIDGDDGASAGKLVMTLMIKIVTQATMMMFLFMMLI